MFLAYDGIVFDMLFLDGWQVESDRSSDDVDFLCWHHIIDVTCILNEAATAAYKFPPTENSRESLNRVQARVFNDRLRGKKTLNKLRSGQIPGEDVRKLMGYNVQPTNQPINPPVTTLPSGRQAQTSAPPVPPSASSQGAPTSFSAWKTMLQGLDFALKFAASPGSAFVDAAGTVGSVATSAAVSPASVAGVAVDIASLKLPSSEEFGNFITGGIAGVAGGIVGGIVSGWWSAVQAQLNDLGNLLGITGGDIFGQGQPPPGQPVFPELPVKRNLNAPPPNAPPGASSRGWTVPITFQELQNRLNKPRRTLAVWLNSGHNGEPEYMLFSPYAGLACDRLNGPVCKIMHIPAIHGNVTGILKLRFETWVAPPPEIVAATDLVTGNLDLQNNSLHNPGFSGGGSSSGGQPNVTNPASLLGGGAVQAIPNLNAQTGIGFVAGAAAGIVNPQGANPAGGGFFPDFKKNAGNGTGQIIGNRTFLLTPPLISNRWTMRQVPDPATHLNTTIIQGTAHFRMDVLQALQMSPDQLRPFFMHPIPFGYVRMPPEVTLLSDGASVQYTIVDVQQMLNNPGGQRWGVHSVKARQVMSYNSPIDYVRTPFSQPTSLPNFIAAGINIAGKMPRLPGV